MKNALDYNIKDIIATKYFEDADLTTWLVDGEQLNLWQFLKEIDDKTLNLWLDPDSKQMGLEWLVATSAAIYANELDTDLVNVIDSKDVYLKLATVDILKTSLIMEAAYRQGVYTLDTRGMQMMRLVQKAKQEIKDGQKEKAM